MGFFIRIGPEYFVKPCDECGTEHSEKRGCPPDADRMARSAS